MSVRRLPIVAALLLGLIALIVFGSEREAVPNSSFASLPAPGMPSAPSAPSLTTSWFCPGVPASEDRGGDVIVTNPGDVPVRGRLTVFSTAGAPVVQPVQVGVRDSATYKLEEIATGDYLSALVEIDSGLGFAEQRARHPKGISLQPCSNASSSTWYLADGLTERSGYDLVVTNPFADYTNVSITIATEAGVHTPSELQNQTVPGRSTVKLDLEAFGLRDENIVAVAIQASPQRVIVGRAQNYQGGRGRGGYSMTLAAPSLQRSWFFPDGEKGAGVSESISVYNPSDQAASIQLEIFTENEPDATFIGTEEFDVEAEQVLVIDVDSIEGLPEGRHSIGVTSSATPIVAEQAITRDAGGSPATAVVMGSRVIEPRWWVPTPIGATSENSLIVANRTALDGAVTVLALGPGGLVPVAGLQDIPLPAAVEGIGGTLALDLTAEEVLGKSLVIESSVDIAVVRRPLRGGDLQGRTAVLAMPEIG